MNMRQLFCATATTILVFAAHAVFLAQSAHQDALRFEVASVKPALSPSEMSLQRVRGSDGQLHPVRLGMRTFPGGRFTATSVSVLMLIARAYGVREYQIEGELPWLASEFFTIDGRANRNASNAEIDEMLKALLADRFALRVHASTRYGAVHALVVARNDGRLGPSLRPTSAACAAELEAVRRALQKDPAGALPPGTGGRLCGSGYQKPGARPRDVTGAWYGFPIAKIVDDIIRELNEPVVDRTGLTGRFDYTLEYETTRLPPQSFGGAESAANELPKPPLRHALEQQLGLKLETTTGPVPIIVVDAVQRPAPD